MGEADEPQTRSTFFLPIVYYRQVSVRCPCHFAVGNEELGKAGRTEKGAGIELVGVLCWGSLEEYRDTSPFSPGTLKFLHRAKVLVPKTVVAPWGTGEWAGVKLAGIPMLGGGGRRSKLLMSPCWGSHRGYRDTNGFSGDTSESPKLKHSSALTSGTRYRHLRYVPCGAVPHRTNRYRKSKKK
jgi:hypothetical protein